MAPALTEYLLLSSPLIPGIRTSAIKQDVLGWQLDFKKSSARWNGFAMPGRSRWPTHRRYFAGR